MTQTSSSSKREPVDEATSNLIQSCLELVTFIDWAIQNIEEDIIPKMGEQEFDPQPTLALLRQASASMEGWVFKGVKFRSTLDNPTNLG